MTDLSRSLVQDAADYLDSWVEFRQRYSRVPGIQLAVWHDDALLLSSAHGRADLDADTALTTRHLFRIASHSKTFTATAVLQLVERGALRLDDPAGRWLDFLGDSALAAVSVRELLGHGAGVIRDGRDGDFWQLFHEFPDEKVLQDIATDAADILPANERFKYSNIGYSLLGLIIAAASGQAYNDYVREHIVQRLDLTDTGPEYDADRAAEFASGYSALAYADRRLPIDHVDTAAMAAATGFFSTASDVVRYASAHFHGDDRLLTDASKRLMQRSEWNVDGVDGAYGLGLARATVGDRVILGHGGGYPGHITKTWFDPADRFAVSVLTNAIDGPADAFATGFVRLVNTAVASAPSVAGGPDLSRFTGRFATLWGVVDVVRLGGELYMFRPVADDPTHEPVRLSVVDDQTLRMTGGSGYASYGEMMTYTFADGAVESVRTAAATAHPIERLVRAAGDRDRISVGSPLR